MILFPNTKIIESVERPVAAGQTVDQEGRALTGVLTAGTFGVRFSAGSGTESFVGVSFNTPAVLTRIPLIEDKVQSSANTITLSQTPIGGTIRVRNETSGTVQTAGSPSNANEYSISGNVITLNAAGVGNTIRVWYAYVPTTVQAVALFGNTQPGGQAGLMLGQAGVITRGDVYTTEFDTTSDWVTGGTVRLGASGLFTLGGSGTQLTNVTIIAVPSVGSGVPALGLQIR